MQTENRITLEDTAQSALVKMAEGNIGGFTAMLSIMKNAEVIDPQAAFGGIGPVMTLDTYGIYGSRIHILFKYGCNQNIRRLIMVLRATQLGIFPIDKLINLATGSLILNEDEWGNIDDEVTNRLPYFMKKDYENQKISEN